MQLSAPFWGKREVVPDGVAMAVMVGDVSLVSLNGADVTVIRDWVSPILTNGSKGC